MPAKETAARVRGLTRQVTSLREDLRREAKRSAWAVERVKEKESLVTSLEKKAEEAAFINSRLMHELKTAEEMRETATGLKEAEIQRITQALKQREQETTSWRDRMNDQLMLAATEIFQLENAISKRASSNAALGSACVRKIEKALARVGQKLMAMKDNFQKKPEKMSVVATNNLDEEVISDKLRLEEKEGNVRKILTTYRTSMSRLRDQISKSEKDNQALIQRIQDLENEKALLSKKVEEVESAKQQTARVHETERENFRSTVETLRETCEARLRRIEELEKELAQFQIDRGELESGMLKRELKVEALEAFIARQKRDISEGLKLLSVSRTTQLDIDRSCHSPPGIHFSMQQDRNDEHRSQSTRWSKHPTHVTSPSSPHLIRRQQLQPSMHCGNDFDFLDREIKDMEANIQRVIAP